MFPYIEVLGKTVGLYSVCAIVGFIVTGFTAAQIAKSYDILYEDIILSLLVILGGLLVGGHVLYALVNADNLFSLFCKINSHSFISFVNELLKCVGGMVFYGGFIGATCTLTLYVRKYPDYYKTAIMDIFALCVPLFHCFARIGCFLSGCCYGIESKYGFITHTNTLVPQMNGVTRLPVQLIEATCNLMIFIALKCIHKKKSVEGNLLFIYMYMYSIIRFILEFFRGDEARGFLMWLSTSQWISIVLCCVAVFKYIKIKATLKIVR